MEAVILPDTGGYLGSTLITSNSDNLSDGGTPVNEAHSSAETLKEQAARMEQLLPQLMRRLFTLEPDHPASELPVAQLRVCSILQAGTRTLSAISEELGISVSATTQIADRLEKAGLVERVAGVDDRRTKHLQLSPHGQAIMHSRRSRRVARAEQALAELTTAQRESTLTVLRALLDAAQTTAPEVKSEDPTGLRLQQ